MNNRRRSRRLKINEYQKECLRTEAGIKYATDNDGQASSDLRLLNGLMGLNGEAGECIDILKKYLFQGHELDKEHLVEELGDVAWYLSITADALGYSLQEIFRMNIEKLRKRYPNGFEEERSVNRNDE